MLARSAILKQSILVSQSAELYTMAPSLEVEKPAQYLPVKAVSAIGNGDVDGLRLASPEKHERVMNVFRAFIADLCQQYGEGHAG